jgi:DNA-binding IclR family transcriptional regulator
MNHPIDSKIRVQVIDRVFRLMKVLTQLEPGARLIEIASRAGLHASTTCRLLNDMAACGLVKTAGHGRYSIGFTRLQHGPALLQFASYADWISKAHTRYASLNKLVSHHQYITLDSLGRVCVAGIEMKRAHDDNAFPVTVYHINPVWRHPSDKAMDASLAKVAPKESATTAGT